MDIILQGNINFLTQNNYKYLEMKHNISRKSYLIKQINTNDSRKKLYVIYT